MVKANINKFYFYRIFTSFNIFTPVFVLLMIDTGLSITEIFILEAAYTFCLALFDIPTGAFADKYGRKKSLIISSFVLMSAYITFGYSQTFWHFLISEILFAASAAFWLSQGSSFIYDTLRQIGDEHKYKKIQGNIETINSLGMCLGGLMAGFVASSMGKQWNAYLMAVPVCIGLLFVFSFKETKIHKSKEKYFEKIKNAFDYTIKHKQLKFLILFTMVVTSMFFFSFIFLQPYLTSLGADVKKIGALFAIYYVVTAFAAFKAHSIEQKLQEKLSLYMIMALMALSLFVFYYTNSLFVAGLVLFTTGAVRGFYIVVLSDYLHRHIPSEKRATIISFQLLMEDITITAFAPLIGWFADLYSIKTALLLCSIILCLFIVVVFFIYSFENHENLRVAEKNSIKKRGAENEGN